MGFWKDGFWKTGFWKSNFWTGVGAPAPPLLETVPYLIGSTRDAAVAAIESIYSVANVIGTTGTVLSQSPNPFDTVVRGATITITLGGPINALHRSSGGGLPSYNSW